LDVNESVVATASRVGNLYVYDEKVSVNAAEANVIAPEDIAEHRRHGHLNGDSNVHAIDCEDCLKAKFTRFLWVVSVILFLFWMKVQVSLFARFYR
jgi:hypothetical protein